MGAEPGTPRSAGTRPVVAAAAFVVLAVLISPGEADEPRIDELRVCADPNNLPFSNDAEQGFENRIAEIVADEVGAPLSYTWWAQRRGFIRNTLGAGACDLVVGVPAESENVETTRPYYRSTYVFVHRAQLEPPLESMLDPRLRELDIGVHLIGDDGANPPPVHALGRLGIVDNVSGYPIYGDYRQRDPPARVIDAVARGDIDVAAVWGPLGGYFAHRTPTVLVVSPIVDTERFAGLPFEFSVAMGVRKGETLLRDRLQRVLDRRGRDIRQVLIDYHVPLIPTEQEVSR